MSERARVLYHIAIPIKIPNSNKSQWTRVGVVVRSSTGKLFGKLNFKPVGPWDGGFSLFEDDKPKAGASTEFPEAEDELESPPPELP